MFLSYFFHDNLTVSCPDGAVSTYCQKLVTEAQTLLVVTSLKGRLISKALVPDL